MRDGLEECIVTMVPRCQCGYIFERLTLAPETGAFYPDRCKSCGKHIKSVVTPGVGLKYGRFVFAETDEDPALPTR